MLQIEKQKTRKGESVKYGYSPEEQKRRKERNKRHREGSLAIMQCGMSERVGILVSQIRWF